MYMYVLNRTVCANTRILLEHDFWLISFDT